MTKNRKKSPKFAKNHPFFTIFHLFTPLFTFPKGRESEPTTPKTVYYTPKPLIYTPKCSKMSQNDQFTFQIPHFHVFPNHSTTQFTSRYTVFMSQPLKFTPVDPPNHEFTPPNHEIRPPNHKIGPPNHTNLSNTFIVRVGHF